MKDKVSVVLAVLNEAKSIRDSVSSLLGQRKSGFDLEILVVDGGSTDGTQEIVKELLHDQPEGVVRLLHNPKKIAPVAFNVGVTSATGNYIAIFGAHAEYARDYIAECYSELQDKQAIGCSGKVLPRMREQTQESELCLKILTSSIGVSSGSFRTRPSSYVESIPYGVFKKEVFEEVGLYDERLVRNQDNDMNARITRAGHKLFLTDKTYAYYYPKSDIKKLRQYALSSGLWNARSLKLGSYTLRWLHFVPFFFLLFNLFLVPLLIVSMVYAHFCLVYAWLLVFVLYLILVLMESTKISFHFPRNRWLFPKEVYLFHLSYGLGTLKGFFK